MMVLIFLATLLLAFAITPLVIWLYRRYNWIDDPKKNSHPKVVHQEPLPRGGGIIIFAAIFLMSLIALPFSPTLIGIMGGAALLMGLGIWDDLQDPPPLLRFGVQGIAALCVILSGVGITYVTNPFGEGILNFSTLSLPTVVAVPPQLIAVGLTLIWIVWCMNIVNFSKGVDGQMPGYVVIAAVVIAILSLRFADDPSQFVVTTLSVIVAGAFAGFLFWNAYPQKILPGFGASTLAGFFLAVLSILSGAKLATAILVLAIPMLDAGFVILDRIKRGRSPFLGDRTHLHHRLLDLGWSKRSIAIFYWVTAAILGFLALQLQSEQKVFTLAAVTIGVVGALVWLRYFTTSLVKSDPDNG